MNTPAPLEQILRDRLRDTPILLMSHLVLGYPSLEENRRVIDAMVRAGVEIMELQIPFSEPSADGPVIAQANQLALEGGFSVRDGLAFIGETVQRHPIPFLIMTYYNILHAYGVPDFIREAARLGVKGLIIPDLPLEEAEEAMEMCREQGLAWIQLLTPTTPDERMQRLGAAAQGFCYCVARKGVTGKQTDFGSELSTFIRRCRAATSLPLAVGFGVKRPEDVAILSGQCEIAVVGTAAIELHRDHGVEAVEGFFTGLRP